MWHKRAMVGINAVQMLTRFCERFYRFVCGFSSSLVIMPEKEEEDAATGEREDAMLQNRLCDNDGEVWMRLVSDRRHVVARCSQPACSVASRCISSICSSHALPPAWAWVTDIGDHTVFVDRTHGFTVGVFADGTTAVRRNCVYMALLKSARDQWSAAPSN
ncbi:hypothetical protein ABZP36_026230 [Zizania latifolia]